MDKEQGNQIIIKEDTVVSEIDGRAISAETLQRWAYRRLATWPAMFQELKDLACLDKTSMSKKQVRLASSRARDLLNVIDKA